MYSFDVYDTLITRQVYEPKGIWDLMSFILLQDNKWNLDILFRMNFAYIRSDAEKQARKNTSQEITIDDIYKVIKNNHELSDEICFHLKELEMSCELDNTIVIKENIDKIKKMKKSGEHIVLISDMYLPKNFFEKLFNRICPMLNDLKLYLSCDIGITKASGLMYEYVSKEEGISHHQWIHQGDNIISDVNIPELYGITAIHYNKTENSDLIKKMDRMVMTNSAIFRQYLLGLIKKTRTDVTYAYRIGYGFVGVALYAYVDWILKQSNKRNIKKLYFIARDGYILKKIADIIIEKYKFDIKTFYLYGSRNAWRTEEKEQRRLVLQYLEQEFKCDYTSMALVDTQGTGCSIEYIANITGCKFTVFYYALFGDMMNRKIAPVCFSSGVGGSIIEVLCRAPHGLTIEYLNQEGKILPKLKLIDESAYEKSDYYSYIKGIEDFTRDYAEINKNIGDIPNGNISEEIVRYCLKTPDRELADFLGEIPFDENNENETLVYAPKINRETIEEIELKRTTEKIETIYTGHDIWTSYSRLNIEERAYLEECQKRFKEKSISKSKSALKVIIYGFGVYGKELYHRLHLNTEIEVVDIIDVNHQTFVGKIPKVNPIKKINTDVYDIVVITLYDEKISMQIRKMLISAGIEDRKILDMKVFERQYET